MRIGFWRAKTRKASEITSGRFPVDRLPAVTDEFFLVGTGANMEERAVSAEYTAPTRSMFVPVSVAGTPEDGVGWLVWHVTMLGAVGNNVCFSFRVPPDFSSLVGAYIIFWGGEASGTFDWTCTTAWGAVGEDRDTNSDSDTADGQECTPKKMYALDVSAALTGIVAGDAIGMKFNKDAESGADVDPSVLVLQLQYSE